MKNTLFTTPSSMQRHSRCKVGATLHSCRQSRANTEVGVTLIEVLVVIIIVALMASMAAPSFSSFIANNRISSATNDLIADLMQARSTASTNGQKVVVCASTNGTSCSTVVSNWAIGRIVFIDKNANGIFDAGDTLIKYATGLPSKLTVTMTETPVFPCTNCIVYYAYGGMFPIGTAQFTLHVTGASQGRQISIDYSGRPSAAKI
jgi:prepilin-type N-terminal cleavage/methylation domain-containing protein